MSSSLSSGSPLHYCVFKGKEFFITSGVQICLLTHLRSQDNDLMVPTWENSSTAESRIQGTFKGGSTAPHNPLNRGPTQQLPRHILSSNPIAQLHTIKISRKQGNMKSVQKKLLCDWGGGGEGEGGDKTNTPIPLPSILHSFPSQGGSAAVQDLCYTPSHEITFLRGSLLEMCWYTQTACFYGLCAHHRCHRDLCCLL